jgi:uncharacterized protein (TIGR03435 family)
MATLTRVTIGWLEEHSVVRDATELTETFDVDLRWTPPPTPILPADAPSEVIRAVGAIDSNGPSVFTAVQGQLGLKLESANGLVDMLIIDHMEHPSEN